MHRHSLVLYSLFLEWKLFGKVKQPKGEEVGTKILIACSSMFAGGGLTLLLAAERPWVRITGAFMLIFNGLYSVLTKRDSLTSTTKAEGYVKK